MNKISTASIAPTVTSAFIGAGFVSGQELWQFFGVFGKTGIFTLFLSLILLGILCAIFMHYCKSTKNYYLDTAVLGSAPKWVNGVFCACEMILYFFLGVIMTSGFTALVDSFTSSGVALAAGAVFALVTGISLFFGLGGVIRLSSVFIPLLVLSTVVISVITLAKNGIQIPEAGEIEAENPLLKFPLLSCFLSLSYNFFGSVGIMAPLTEKAKNSKQLVISSVISTVFLVVIAVSILLSTFTTGMHDKALPMLEISKAIGLPFAIIYAILLSLAMYSCSFSSSVCIVLFAEKKLLHTKKRKIIFILLYMLMVYTVSTVGFSDLISTVYPIFGYVGFILIFIVIYNAVTNRRKPNV